MNKEEYNLVKKLIEDEKKKELARQALPPKGGKYSKPKAKSTDRHRRESTACLARVSGISATTYRRAEYINAHGSEELIEACRKGEITIRRAFDIAQSQVIVKAWNSSQEAKKKHEEVKE